MAWETVERRISGQTTKPASMSLRAIIRNGVAISRPSCMVTVRFGLATELNWGKLEPVGVQLGSGEHAGLLRIIRNGANPVAKVRVLQRGGFSLNLGHIPQFGMEHREKAATDARIIDADTVEVVIPDWSAQPAAKSTKGAEYVATEPSVVPPPKVVANGVTIIFEDGNEHIEFGGKKVEATSRQAKFCAVLCRTMPEPVGRTDLAKRMWGAQSPLRVDEVLDQIAKDLGQELKPIGLTIKPYRGVGYALAKAA